MLTVLAGIATFERRRIGERISEALRAKKARGERVGRAVLLPDDVADLIHDMRSEGMTYAAIAAELADEGIPTATGRGRRQHPTRQHRPVLRRGHHRGLQPRPAAVLPPEPHHPSPDGHLLGPPPSTVSTSGDPAPPTGTTRAFLGGRSGPLRAVSWRKAI